MRHKNKLLVEEVLEQIEKDVKFGDMTALEELLFYVPEERLEQYLPETGTDPLLIFPYH